MPRKLFLTFFVAHADGANAFGRVPSAVLPFNAEPALAWPSAAPRPTGAGIGGPGGDPHDLVCAACRTQGRRVLFVLLLLESLPTAFAHEIVAWHLTPSSSAAEPVGTLPAGSRPLWCTVTVILHLLFLSSVPEAAGISHSGGDSQPGQDVLLQQHPSHHHTRRDHYLSHVIPFSKISAPGAEHPYIKPYI